MNIDEPVRQHRQTAFGTMLREWRRLRGSSLNPYFAAPHGDMMISGCFGLLDAYAEKYPDAREVINARLAD